MPRLIAATDFSTRSQRALRRAGLVAKQSNAELALVHVVDDDQPQELVELEEREANRFLNEQAESLAELRGVGCRAIVATGEAFDGILRTAENFSADLIVMGTHRKELLRDIFIGTTIERVIRTGSYPVLMVNRDPERPYSRALAAVDMSEPSARAIETAEHFGLFDATSVTVVHAFDAVAKGKLFVANAAPERIEEYVANERSQASRELAAFFAAHEIHGEGWPQRIEEGEAFEVIANAVRETAADLLVLGAHGRNDLARLLLGSVAEQALRSLDVDILASPPPPPAREA